MTKRLRIKIELTHPKTQLILGITIMIVSIIIAVTICILAHEKGGFKELFNCPHEKIEKKK